MQVKLLLPRKEFVKRHQLIMVVMHQYNGINGIIYFSNFERPLGSWIGYLLSLVRESGFLL